MPTRCALVIVVIFMLTMSLQAQPDSLWSHTFGGRFADKGWSVQQTTDGGFVIVGTTCSFGAGETDVWIIKTDINGDSLWSRTFGGEEDDNGKCIQQTADGGFVIVGYTASFGESFGDVWLIRTNADGDSLWARTYGGIDPDEGQSVQQTTDGGFVIVGRTWSFGAGVSDVWLIRTNTDGDSLWSRTFGEGWAEDDGMSVQQTADGGFVIVGKTGDGGDGSDIWLIRTDADGDSLWSHSFGGGSGDFGYSVQETDDGGFVIGGSTHSFGAGSFDVWLIRTDADGDALWSHTYGGDGYDWCSSVQKTVDGGFLIAGYTELFGAGNCDIWLIKTDAEGDTLWSCIFGGESWEYGTGAQQTVDDGFVITGYTRSFGAGECDVWLVKTGPDPVSVPESQSTWQPSTFAILGVWPNPFNAMAKVRFSQPAGSWLRFEVLDVTGRFQGLLTEWQYYPAGLHSLVWDARSQPAGLYWMRLQNQRGMSVLQPMVILK